MPRRKGSPEPPDPEQLPQGTPCWEYARDSGGDRQVKSVPDQVAAMDADAERRGWVVVDRFLDKKRKGGDAGRQEFNRLLQRLDERPCPVQVLLIWDHKRLARDEGLGYELLAHAYRAGVGLLSVSFPLPAAARRYAEPFLIVAAADESRAQGRAVARGLRSMMAENYAPGGLAPLGYKVEYVEVGRFRNGLPQMWPRWVIDEEARDRVALAWEMHQAGNDFFSIIAATGLETTRGALSVRFRNPAYCGFPHWWLRHHGRTVAECADIPPAVEPYVSVATFLRCQAGRADHPRRASGGYPLSGMSYCACGASLVVHARESGGPYHYRCCTRHNHGRCPAGTRDTAGRTLELQLLQELATHFAPERMGEIVEEVNAGLEALYSDADAERRRLDADLDQATAEVENLVEAIARAGYSESLVSGLRAAEERIAALRDRRAQLPGRNDPRYVDPADAAALELLFLEEVTKLERRDLRELFRAMGLRLVLHADHAEASIDWPPMELFFAGSKKLPLGSMCLSTHPAGRLGLAFTLRRPAEVRAAR